MDHWLKEQLNDAHKILDEMGVPKSEVRVLDLFSGIGGFSLGLERAGMRTVAFCEIEPYCQRVLAKHWPGVQCHGDVRTLQVERGMADVVTAGFPCQDISHAGFAAGLSGTRSGLWWQVRRTIRVVRPRFAILENVAALLSRGLGTVLGSLAALGYDTEWHCIPLGHVGAPHERDRIWIVAHTEETGQQNDEGRTGSEAQRYERQIITPNIIEFGAYDWPPEPKVVRVVDGLSADVDAVAALGNSLGPKITEIIGRAIMNCQQ